MRRTAVWKWAGSLLASMAIVGVAFAQGADEKGSKASEPGWLGVYTQELTDDLREALGVQASGVLVSQVIDSSPADRAGLRKGDIILSVNDRAVENSDAFTEMIRSRKAGDEVAIRILRDDKRQTLSVTLGARSEWTDDGDDEYDDANRSFRVVIPDEREFRRMARDFGDAAKYDFSLGRGRLGVRVQDMNQDLGEYFKAADGKGALVVGVVDDSPAEKAGIRSGDVIVKVGDDPVDDTDDLVRELREREGKVAIEVLRKGTKQTVTAELEEPVATRIHRGQRAFVFDHDGWDGTDEELQREIENLRRELQQLRKELQELRRD